MILPVLISNKKSAINPIFEPFIFIRLASINVGNLFKVAKSEIADIVAGEMNKESKQFITEIGKTNNMSVVSDVEVTLINIISKTQVRGYEMWKKDVTITKNGYYRVWIGLRLPMGEFNKMYNYTIEAALDSYKLKELANDSYKKLLENTGNTDENSNL